MKRKILLKCTAVAFCITTITLLTALTTIFVTANNEEPAYEHLTKHKQIDTNTTNVGKTLPEPETANETPQLLALPPLPVVQVAEYEYAQEYTATPEPEEFQPTEFVRVLSQPIAAARCHFKSWMDWRSITARNSQQWRMQQIAYTCDLGFRRVDGLYMIALGTYFLYHGVGDVFEITLSGGRTFRAVVGDVKSDRHTDPTNRFHISDGSLIEFIVDRQVMSQYVLRTRGDVSFAGFPGYIVSMYRIPELFVSV